MVLYYRSEHKMGILRLHLKNWVIDHLPFKYIFICLKILSREVYWSA